MPVETRRRDAEAKEFVLLKFSVLIETASKHAEGEEKGHDSMRRGQEFTVLMWEDKGGSCGSVPGPWPKHNSALPPDFASDDLRVATISNQQSGPRHPHNSFVWGQDTSSVSRSSPFVESNRSQSLGKIGLITTSQFTKASLILFSTAGSSEDSI